MTLKFAEMSLSRVIPRHVHRVKFRWCKTDFMVMSDQYRKVRERCSRPMDSCRWCHHEFTNGEMMALAQPEKGSNWLLCQTCAGQLVAAQETKVQQNTGAPDCPKCHGAGWLRGSELGNPSDDTCADTMTRYSCDSEQCRRAAHG